jgi:putative NADH-flavin reductase
MKIALFGATGQTGSRALRLLLDRGDEVTVLARDPAKVTLKSEKLHVVAGDARDAEAVAKTIQGQDAVLAAFGPRSLKSDDIQEVFMRHVIEGMKRHGVKRLVNLSAWGMGLTEAHAVWMMKHLFVPLILKNVAQDKAKGEALLAPSGLDYVNVAPGRLTNGQPRGGVKASEDGKGLKPMLTRDDLAAFMVRQLTDGAWVRKSPIIGY